MTKPTVSIIIPVYNGAKYIKQTLDSLLSQVTGDLEVIVVDDGSQDDTVAIIKRYFVQCIDNGLLHIFSRENSGVSAARNFGIDHARGDYIGFMDADDLALPAYLDTIFEAVTLKTDIVEFGFKAFVDSACDANRNRAMYSNKQFGQHVVTEVLDHVYSIARWYPWTRLFRKSLFDTVRFPEKVRFCEDLMTIPYLYEKAETIAVLDNAIYGYRRNQNSATFSVKTDYVENLVDFYRKTPYPDLPRYKYFRISVAFAISSCLNKVKDSYSLPNDIENDMSKLRWFLPVYWHINPRVIAVLFYPATYQFLRSIFRFVKQKGISG